MRFHFARTAAVAVAATLAWAAPASAAVILTDATDTDVIPAVANFATTGSMMSGMTVTLTFDGGATETVAWQTTGATSGGVIGTGWSLSLDGDSFGAPWQADFGDLIVTTMELDGRPGLVLFDTTFTGAGTAGSEAGLDFLTSLASDGAITATYSRQVALSGDAPIGDLWSVLTVDFSDVLQEQPFGTFTFVQDTDNDARRVTEVPAPAAAALFAFALVGFAGFRRLRA